MELYQTVIWDLVDALAGQWNTLDIESFSSVLARSHVYCIVLPTFPQDLREAVDLKLRPSKGYLGALQLDIGNPLQFRIFIESLVDDAFITHGAIYLEGNWDARDDIVFEGASDFSPGGEKRLAPEDFHKQKPPLPNRSSLSDRGKVSAERYAGKRTYTIADRVIDGISRLQCAAKGLFALSSSSNPNMVLEAHLPEAKFVQYLLNPDHKDGAGKAKFFRDVLAITGDI